MSIEESSLSVTAVFVSVLGLQLVLLSYQVLKSVYTYSHLFPPSLASPTPEPSIH